MRPTVTTGVERVGRSSFRGNMARSGSGDRGAVLGNSQRGFGPAVRGEQSRNPSRRTSRGWGPAILGERSGRSSRRTSRGWGPAVRGERPAIVAPAKPALERRSPCTSFSDSVLPSRWAQAHHRGRAEVGARHPPHVAGGDGLHVLHVSPGKIVPHAGGLEEGRIPGQSPIGAPVEGKLAEQVCLGA